MFDFFAVIYHVYRKFVPRPAPPFGRVTREIWLMEFLVAWANPGWPFANLQSDVGQSTTVRFGETGFPPPDGGSGGVMAFPVTGKSKV